MWKMSKEEENKKGEERNTLLRNRLALWASEAPPAGDLSEMGRPCL